METQHKSRTTGLGDHVTSTISVTLVLFILGLVSMVGIAVDSITTEIKQNVGFTVVLQDEVPQSKINALKQECTSAPYVSSYNYLSADDVMAEETAGEGDDLVALLGVNPYSPMFEIKVKAAYAEMDSLSTIVEHWRADEAVEEVAVNTEMIDNISSNANMLAAILLVVAAALLLISFVLINNTVRLTVYARRFLIHTMKLVGATDSFIRRPFIVVNLLQGVIAALLASGLLSLLLSYVFSLDPAVKMALTWADAALVFVGLLVLGVVICAVAAFIATSRYLRLDYDEMFN